MKKFISTLGIITLSMSILSCSRTMTEAEDEELIEETMNHKTNYYSKTGDSLLLNADTGDDDKKDRQQWRVSP